MAAPRARRRGRVLLRIADLLEEQRDELALTVSLEMGKPITDAHDIELRAAINTFRWYGQLADKLTDESPHTAPDALALVTREPAGVVGAVVPWNFPLTLASWKVAPALAAGCTGRAEAVGELAAVRAAARPAGHRGRAAAGRTQRRHR